MLQQHEAEQIADEESLKVGLLAKLIRRPRWLVGIGADVGGYVFEAAALGAGALVLVEPILATALVFSLLFGWLIHGRQVSSAGLGRGVPPRSQHVALPVPGVTERW